MGFKDDVELGKVSEAASLSLFNTPAVHASSLIWARSGVGRQLSFSVSSLGFSQLQLNPLS